MRANTTILGELVKNLEISKLSLLRETPLIQVIDCPVLPLPVERLSKLKALVLGGMLAGFLPTLYLLARKLFRDRLG